MIVLLHGGHPRHVVKRHRAEAEVRVVGDLAHFLNKAVEVRRRDTIDSSQEVGGSKTVMVRGRATALNRGVSKSAIAEKSQSKQVLTLALT